MLTTEKQKESELARILTKDEEANSKELERIKDSANAKIAEEKRRMERELIKTTSEIVRQRDEEFIRQTEDSITRSQEKIFAQMRAVSDAIAERSSNFYNNRETFDQAETPLYFSILYTHVHRDIDTTIGLVMPTDIASPDNGARHLPDRIKAITLETLLKAKKTAQELNEDNAKNSESTQVVDIDRITTIPSGPLSIFAIDLRQNPTLFYKNDFSMSYEDTLTLDTLLSDAFDNDPILKEAGIVYAPCYGLTMRELNLERLGTINDTGIHEVVEESANGMDEYIDEDTAVDMIFRLDPAQPGYKRIHQIAKRKFGQELLCQTFKIEFDDFHMKEKDGKKYFKTSGIKDLIEGVKETVTISGKPSQTVHRHYAVPEGGNYLNMRFFECGAYTEEDACTKYMISQHKLNYNFEDEGLLKDDYKKERIRLTDSSGEEILLYRLEDLQAVSMKRDKNASRKAS